MTGIGYVVRLEYLDLARSLAPDARLARIEALSNAVRELDELEVSFPSRLAAAREADDGVEHLSSAANEMIAVSSDADREYHRLLHRRCRRADSDTSVIRELLESARGDVKNWSFIADGAPDAIGARLASELVDRKRTVVALLRDYLAEAGASDDADPQGTP